jgi:putative DNA primase/helicase
MIKAITTVDPPITRNIPEELTERTQWVCWRSEMRDGKPTKVPYNPEDGQKAATNNSMTWSTFEDALEAYEASEGRYSGIGFVFSSGDPYTGIDLDRCRNPKTGDIAPWAQEFIAAASGEGYVEVSPSGKGVHIIVEGVVSSAGGGMRKGNVEMYCRGRFFTVTGRTL